MRVDVIQSEIDKRDYVDNTIRSVYYLSIPNLEDLFEDLFRNQFRDVVSSFIGAVGITKLEGFYAEAMCVKPESILPKYLQTRFGVVLRLFSYFDYLDMLKITRLDAGERFAALINAKLSELAKIPMNDPVVEAGFGVYSDSQGYAPPDIDIAFPSGAFRNMPDFIEQLEEVLGKAGRSHASRDKKTGEYLAVFLTPPEVAMLLETGLVGKAYYSASGESIGEEEIITLAKSFVDVNCGRYAIILENGTFRSYNIT